MVYCRTWHCVLTTTHHQNPGATTGSGPLYMKAPKMLEAKLRPNLDKPLRELIQDGGVIDFTDAGKT